jgi:4,5-DOPA dioxygenase extradiol
MNRRKFIRIGTLTTMTAAFSSLKGLENLPDNSEMPVLFIGHGSPMNAIEQNEFTKNWTEMGKDVPKPKAILVVSAHWETRGTQVTAMKNPKTIHDFGGFPQALFDVEYKAPGSPELAAEIPELIHSAGVSQDLTWGLDHGAWSVLKPMFPLADIPVIQLSLDYLKTPAQHYELGKELAALRKKGVLIIGSGNIVHNLGMMNWNAKNTGFDWAIEFNQRVKDAIDQQLSAKLINYKLLSSAAQLAVPSTEHYLPLLYAIALRKPDEPILYFNDSPVMGSLTMTSLRIG